MIRKNPENRWFIIYYHWVALVCTHCQQDYFADVFTKAVNCYATNKDSVWLPYVKVTLISSLFYFSRSPGLLHVQKHRQYIGRQEDVELVLC